VGGAARHRAVESSLAIAKMVSRPWFGEFFTSKRRGGPWQAYTLITVTRNDILKGSGGGGPCSSSRVGAHHLLGCSGSQTRLEAAMTLPEACQVVQSLQKSVEDHVPWFGRVLVFAVGNWGPRRTIL
jgi:hypothetical protein